MALPKSAEQHPPPPPDSRHHATSPLHSTPQPMPPPESPLWPTPASLLKLRTGQQQNNRSAHSVLHDTSSMLANAYVDNIKVKLDSVMKQPVHTFDGQRPQSQDTRHVVSSGRAAPSEKSADTAHDKTSFIDNDSHEWIAFYLLKP